MRFTSMTSSGTTPLRLSAIRTRNVASERQNPNSFTGSPLDELEARRRERAGPVVVAGIDSRNCDAGIHTILLARGARRALGSGGRPTAAHKQQQIGRIDMTTVDDARAKGAKGGPTHQHRSEVRDGMRIDWDVP